MAVLPSAHALIIDDFSVGPIVLTDTEAFGVVSEVQTGLDPARVAGGSRAITFEALDVSFPFDTAGSVTVAVATDGGGALQHTPDPGFTAANFFVNYGNTDLGQSPISLDFLTNGADRLRFEFNFTTAFITPVVPTVAFDLLLDSGGGSALDFVIFESVNAPTTVDVLFSDILALNPDFDLTDVTGLTFGTSNGTLDGPFELASIRVVPEPTAVLVMAPCVFGLMRRRRDGQRP